MNKGVNAHFFWSATTDWVVPWLDRLNEDGVRYVRVDMAWTGTSPRPSDTQILALVELIGARNMRLKIMIGGSGPLASWAKPDPTAYAAEFGRIAALVPGQFVSLECWNEPNLAA